MSKVKSPTVPKTAETPNGSAQNGKKKPTTADEKLNEIKSLPTHYTNQEWTNGPDNICQADSYIATRLNQPVKLRITEPDRKKFPPLSVYTIFRQTVMQRPDHPALAFKKNIDEERFTMISYLEYWKTSHKAAKSFIKV